MRMLAGILAAGGVLAACDSVSEPLADEQFNAIVQWQAAPGAMTMALAAGGEDEWLNASISAPDTVQVGVAFTATVTTIGLSGCWRAGGADVSLAPSLAVVTPYDYVESLPNEATFCTAVLAQLPRDVELRFDAVGMATIRVVGRRVIGDDMANSVPTSVEKQVFVR